MTIHTPLNIALAANNILPLDCSCPACDDDDLHREDMATTAAFSELTLRMMEERYGAPVCFGCADSHRLCGECNTALADDEGFDVGGEMVCGNCAPVSSGAWSERKQDDLAATQ